MDTASTPDSKRHPSLPNLGRILILMDEKLTKGKRALLQRLIVTFKQFAEVVVAPESTPEDGVLTLMTQQEFHLVLLPWHHYRVWRRVEAFYGLQRTSGPTVAGYFCDPLSADLLGSSLDLTRFILLDFCHLGSKEISTLVGSLIQDKRRTGLIPLLRAGTKIYTENWYGSHGLGYRLDNLFSLAEIKERDWTDHLIPVRSVLLSLWGLIYDEGPGKSEFRQSISATNPIACFQVGIDDRFFLFRLCYRMTGATPKTLLNRFWSMHESQSLITRLLLQHSDFLRAHVISATSEIEIVAGISKNPSASAPHSTATLKTLWIEPVEAHLFQEIPFEEPDTDPNSPSLLRALPQTAAPALEIVRYRERELALERAVTVTGQKVKDLAKMLEQREQTIAELKFGGVGNASQASIPDGDNLLDAFEQRFHELENEILDLNNQLASPEAAKSARNTAELKRKLEKLKSKEKRWLQQVQQFLELHRMLHSPPPVKKGA